MRRKLSAIIILIVISATLFVSCSAPAMDRPEMIPGAVSVKVTGSIEAVVENGVVKINGTCDIDSGTIGTISVFSTDGKEVDLFKFTKQSDEISHEFAITEKYPDEFYAFIVFDTDHSGKQSKEILAKYGKKFENIEASDIIKWNTYGQFVIIQSDLLKKG